MDKSLRLTGDKSLREVIARKQKHDIRSGVEALPSGVRAVGRFVRSAGGRSRHGRRLRKLSLDRGQWAQQLVPASPFLRTAQPRVHGQRGRRPRAIAQSGLESVSGRATYCHLTRRQSKSSEGRGPDGAVPGNHYSDNSHFLCSVTVDHSHQATVQQQVIQHHSLVLGFIWAVKRNAIRPCRTPRTASRSSHMPTEIGPNSTSSYCADAMIGSGADQSRAN